MQEWKEVQRRLFGRLSKLAPLCGQEEALKSQYEATQRIVMGELFDVASDGCSLMECEEFVASHGSRRDAADFLTKKCSPYFGGEPWASISLMVREIPDRADWVNHDREWLRLESRRLALARTTKPKIPQPASERLSQSRGESEVASNHGPPAKSNGKPVQASPVGTPKATPKELIAVKPLAAAINAITTQCTPQAQRKVMDAAAVIESGSAKHDDKLKAAAQILAVCHVEVDDAEADDLAGMSKDQLIRLVMKLRKNVADLEAENKRLKRKQLAMAGT